jgi:trans-aconitate 2-methyltransferase
MKTPKEISEYYDQYTDKQQQMWHNERHYFLLDQLKLQGVKSNSNILEIGCGIGTMTNLIAPLLTNGSLTSTDISPKSIELAKKNNAKFKNINFIAADSTNLHFPKLNYDFIVLFDVLEHIQNEFRSDFIKNIATVMGENTKFLVNVPAPHAHIHAIQNSPELMQIVEVPVWVEEFIVILKNNGLEIKSFFTYDMWQKEEYQFYLIEKAKSYVFVKTIPDEKYNPHSISKRVKRKIDKLKGH